MNWDDVGDAIHAAVARASGLAPELVIWKDQNQGAPSLDYVTIRLGTMIPLGIDSITKRFDASRPRGQEFEARTTGTRETTIEVEGFTSQSVSGRSAAALALVSRIYSGLLLESTREILRAQDVCVFDVSSVTWVPDLPSTRFRGRAVGTLRAYMPAPTVSEYYGYIERFSGTIEAVDAGGELTVLAFDSGAADYEPGTED